MLLVDAARGEVTCVIEVNILMILLLLFCFATRQASCLVVSLTQVKTASGNPLMALYEDLERWGWMVVPTCRQKEYIELPKSPYTEEIFSISPHLQRTFTLPGISDSRDCWILSAAKRSSSLRRTTRTSSSGSRST